MTGVTTATLGIALVNTLAVGLAVLALFLMGAVASFFVAACGVDLTQLLGLARPELGAVWYGAALICVPGIVWFSFATM